MQFLSLFYEICISFEHKHLILSKISLLIFILCIFITNLTLFITFRIILIDLLSKFRVLSLENAIMSQKKRKSIDLATKKEILEASKEEPKISELVKRFGLHPNTISGILKSREKIENAIEVETPSKRARLRGPKHEDVELSVLQWFKNARSHQISISGDLIKVS